MVLLLVSTSNQYGTTTLQDSSASATLTIGSKSNQTSAGEYYMRSLAVWKRALSSQEVKGIYLAGKFICLGIWKDECNVLRYRPKCRTSIAVPFSKTFVAVVFCTKYYPCVPDQICLSCRFFEESLGKSDHSEKNPKN